KGLEELSKDLGTSMVQIALAWLLANPAVTSPIIAASNMKQLEENLTSADVSLSKADLERIDRIAPPKGPYYT
ncbi:MAG: aldo/keto reductase, partial [Candidatus Bathyarchaeota archaeon]